jgi:hypothetical protein
VIGVCDQEEEKDMATVEGVKVDVEKSIAKSLNEVKDIRSGKLPKRSYKEMMNRIRENLKENK